VTVNIKRIYEPFSETDGYRVLVDRLWPRGIKKEEAHLDKWMKEIAPSTALRKWIHHEPDKWDQFIRKYHTELNGSAAFKELLFDITEHKTVTLLFAAKDKDHNHALVLQQFIKSHSA
jgi:uncharacterized protein YeaO (DUF488 family)